MHNFPLNNTMVNNSLKLIDFHDKPENAINFKNIETNKSIYARILSAAKSINSSPSIEDTFRIVIKSAINILNYERGFILLKDDIEEFQIKMALNYKEVEIPVSYSNFFEPVINNVLFTQRANYAKTGIEPGNNQTQNSTESKNIRTIICAPLISGKKNFGVLYIDKKGHDQNLQDNLCYIEFLAEQLSLFIKNSELDNYRLKTLSELEELNRQLVYAKEKAAESAKLKSEFLNHVSHEIRTPVNVIIHYIDILREDFIKNSSNDAGFFFDSIKNNSKRLLRTIDLILNTAQLRSGKCEMQPHKFDIAREIINKLFNEFKNEATEKNIDLFLDDQAKEKFIYADIYCVNQIFTNLIGNAIKYTDHGFVKIKLYNEQNKICISIEDTGKGISGKHIDKLFEQFSQERSGFDSSYEGNGLGLALVKEFLELNKGQLIIKSIKGTGSQFIVMFESFAPGRMAVFS